MSTTEDTTMVIWASPRDFTDWTPDAEADNLLIVPCPLCNGSAVRPRAVWVYEHGCGFGHYDTDEDECPECEGAGLQLVEGEPIELDDLEEMGGPL